MQACKEAMENLKVVIAFCLMSAIAHSFPPNFSTQRLPRLNLLL
jgi:predicted RNase H-like HicB family nuclease